MTGIRAHVVSRLDGKGYDVTKCMSLPFHVGHTRLKSSTFIVGPFAVKTGQIVYVNDSDLVFAPAGGKKALNKPLRFPVIDLRIFISYVDPLFQVQPGMYDRNFEDIVIGHTALFGGDPISHPSGEPIRFGHGEGVRLVMDLENLNGCQPFAQQYDGEALVVYRGECTFLEKLINGKKAGASGVVVIHDEARGVNPSADEGELKSAGVSLDDVAIVVVGRPDGEAILAMMDAAETHGMGHAMLAVVPTDETMEEPKPEEPKTAPERDRSDRKAASEPARVLYLNGHPLLNTRLMV